MSKNLGLLEFLNDYSNWYLSNDFFRIKPDFRCLNPCDTVIFRVSGSSGDELQTKVSSFDNILMSMSLDNTNFFFLWEYDGVKIQYYYGLAADLSTRQCQEVYEKELIDNSQIFEMEYEGAFSESSLIALSDAEKEALLEGFTSYAYSGYLEGTPGIVEGTTYQTALNRIAKVVKKPYRMLVVIQSLTYACVSGLTSYVNWVLDEVSAMQSSTKSRQRSHRRTTTASNTLNCLASNSNTRTDTKQQQRTVLDEEEGIDEGGQAPEEEAEDELLSEDIYGNPDELLEQQSLSACAINDNQPDYERINMMQREGAAAREHRLPLASNNAETGIGTKTNSAINNPQAHATTSPFHVELLDTRTPARAFIGQRREELSDQSNARSVTRSDAFSNAKVCLQSVNDSITKSSTNEEITSITRTEVQTNSLAMDWVNYLTNVVKPQLANAAGYGLYVTGIVLFAQQPAILRQLSSLIRSQWLALSQFVPLKLTTIDWQDERRCAFTSLQLPQYLLDEEECFQQHERIDRSAFTQLLLKSTAYCCNFQSGRNVSYLFQQAGSTSDESV